MRIASRRARVSARMATGASTSTLASIYPTPGAAHLIEDLAPYFVEDPVRSEGFNHLLPVLRKQVRVPIAAGEQWGSRWDFNKLIENNIIDYVRCTIPNVGGITEWTNVAALCETHFIRLIPHFTGPISTAALVHACGPFSGPVLMEFTSQSGT